MKNGWKRTKLSEVCVFKGGGTPSKAVERFWSGEIPWVSPKDMKSEVISDSTDHISKDAINNSAASLIPKDSLLMVVRSGILARTIPLAIAGTPLTINQDLKALCPKDSILPRFLYYLLLHKSEHLLAAVSRGATVHRLQTHDIKELTFYLPTVGEQQRIVAILDQAFEGIATAKANAEKNLQNARELFESHLNAVFTQRGEGWEEKTLKELGTTQTGSTPKTSDKSNYGDAIAFIKPADFNKDGSLKLDNDGLSAKGMLNARIVKKPSVLMVCIGATIGKCAYSDQDITTNQQINSLTPRNGVSSRFIYYQMTTQKFQSDVLHKSSQATLPIINKSKWSSLKVALPKSYNEQERIAAQLGDLHTEVAVIESLYQQKLAALDELKQSLLHKAFAGEL